MNAPERHWDNPNHDAMYDKVLLGLEQSIIRSFIKDGSKICEFGCAEGESTLAYSSIPEATIDAYDISSTRLEMAADRLRNVKNVTLRIADVLDFKTAPYDAVISQRLVINLLDEEKQKKAIETLCALVKPNGRLIISEGSTTGAIKLDRIRAGFGLPPIPLQPHNRFMDDEFLVKQVQSHGLKYKMMKAPGAFYFLTRGIQPALNPGFHWSSDFNRQCATLDIGGCDKYSRIKVWLFKRNET